MAFPSYVKHPDAVLDYGFDYAVDGWLETGETIIASEWDIPSGLEEDTDSSHAASGHDGSTTKVWLGGGTVDEDYDITNHIETSEGRHEYRTMTIMVRNR